MTTTHEQHAIGRHFAFGSTATPRLDLRAHDADIRIVLDAEPGTGSLLLEADEESYLETITTDLKRDRLEVTIPPMLTKGPGKGFALQLGKLSVSLGHTAQVEAELHLPPGSGIEVTTRSGNVSLVGEVGALAVHTESGDVSLAQATQARVQTGSGDIHLADALGSTQLRTASGDVEVARSAQALQVVTGSGDVTVSTVSSGEVEVRSGSGDVHLRITPEVSVWQDLHATSGDRDVRLTPRGEPAEGQAFVTVRVTTGSGDITLVDA